MSFYPAQAYSRQMMGQLPTRTNTLGRVWGDTMTSSATHSIEYNAGYNHDSYQAFGSGSQPSQPEWRTGQNTGLPHAPPQTSVENFGSSNQPHAFYGSYGAPQKTEHSPGYFASQSSQPSNVSLPGPNFSTNHQGLPTTRDSSSAHSHTDIDQMQSSPCHSMTQSRPYQITTFQQQGSHLQGSLGQPPPHGYLPHSSNSMHYHNENIAHTQHGSNSSVHHNGPGAQLDSPCYQDSGYNSRAHHYLPYQPHGTQPGEATAQNAARQPDYNDSRVQRQWGSADPRLSRTSAPDSRFTNGL
ncbi:hypothetical protein N7495_007627 [Penicillium taxi]|uniref:uncharacterized protein n=1 Tax=Penicillium taxi TaxID=168475 RepID=UPI002545AD22|nr:uncharacterized protein N7495_007627 [Penicillium taxi]KAJ5887586.1 hypothetical protein N7495_007627 [Penicillium taxi]